MSQGPGVLVFQIINEKDSNETGTFCFNVRIPWKKQRNNYYGKIPSQIDGSDDRQSV